MRLWSLHPQYLDGRGLVALWREALLAQAVLRSRTRGYRRHPQLVRFRDSVTPVGAIAAYLRAVHAESRHRGYGFDASRISTARARGRLTVSRGQLDYEWRHLLAKLYRRDRERWRQLAAVRRPQPHPLFRVVPGGIASWEKRKTG
jgi:hypothetical protein